MGVAVGGGGGGGAATAATQIQRVMKRSGGGRGRCPSKSMEIRWASRRERSPKSNSVARPLKIPIYISTSPSAVNPEEVRELYSSCNYSCHPFPKDTPLEEVVEIRKLRIALSHSSVLVSVFCKPHHINTIPSKSSSSEEDQNQSQTLMGDFFRRVMPLSPSNGQLVGFGRAVSDFGLTASIYDVMVIPSLRGMGIGRMIVKRIIRMLTSKDIYDIAAVCSENERLFFKACGFGDDVLGSTTMMYTRTVLTCFEGNQMVKRVV